MARPVPRVLALTVGEPAGIGPDIAIDVWRRRAELSLPPFYIVGDSAFLARRAERLGVPVPMRSVAPGEAARVFATALPVGELGLAIPAEPRRPAPPAPPPAIPAIPRPPPAAIPGE